ncbi:MAG: tetratricopeptide repeat protein [Bacteroidales bacterium]|nr:tetratricopeptide repeat protein [Bacteroidales bacterium]
MKMKTFTTRIMMVLLMSFFAIGLIQSQTLDDALKLMKNERLEDAYNMLRDIINKQPNNADAYYYLGEIVLKSYLNDPYSNTLEEAVKEAKQCFEKGLKVDSTRMLNNIGMGIIYLISKNDTISADSYFAKVEKTIPTKYKKFTDQDFTLLIKLGQAQLYASKPRYYKAIAYLEKAKAASADLGARTKKISNEKPEVYIALGDVYLEMNDASAAVANYNKATFINPDLAEPIVKIGRLYMRSRNLQAARNNFDQAKEIDSTYAPLYRAYGELYLMSSGTAQFAKVNFRKFLELSGNNVPAKIQYVNSLFKSKDYKECLENIEEILAYDKSRNYLNRVAAYSAYEMRPPDYNKALRYIEEFFKNTTPEKIISKDYAYYGRILLKLKDKDTSYVSKAFVNLLKAYNMDSTDVELITDIAYNAYYNKLFPLAIRMLQKKIELEQGQASDYMLMGKAYYQMAQGSTDTTFQNKNYREAQRVFARLTQLEPDNVQAYLWIANTSYSLDPDGKLGLALPQYEKVIEVASKDTVKNAAELYEAYRFMGSYYFYNAKPDYDKAERYFTKIIYLDPKKDQWKIMGYSSLAVLYTKKKEYPKALDMYNKILALDPNNVDIKKTVEALKKSMKSQQ